MANQIIDKPYNWELTCNRREDIRIRVDTGVDSLQVIITSPTGNIVYSEKLYAIDGFIRFSNVGEIIEVDLRNRNEIAGNYIMSIKNGDTIEDSFGMRSIYCDRYTPHTETDIFLKENFLTTLQMRRVPADGDVFLYYFAKAGESTASKSYFKYRVKGSEEIQIGVLSTLGRNITEADVYSIVTGPSTFARYLRGLPGHSNDEVIEVIEYTISVGKRSVTFFVDPTLKQDNEFYFRNCFNVWETAYFPYLTTAKTEKEAAVAVLSDRAMLYDQKLKKTYEVETGALTADEAEWIDQLLGSHSVSGVVKNELSDDTGDNVKDIIITEASIDYGEDDEPASAKFTWRYTDNRPPVRLRASPGIFNEQFNNAFS